MDSMQTDPIQTQREVWLRAIVLHDQRVKEEADGAKRLKAAVDVACERMAAEERKLDEMIAAAKVKYDDYKKLPQSLAGSPEEVKAVEEGAAFGEESGASDSEEERSEERLVPRRPVVFGDEASAT